MIRKSRRYKNKEKLTTVTAKRGFVYRYVQYLVLTGIIAAAIAMRWGSADFQALFDADPWWFYRHAQEIYNSGFEPPRWDIQSHFPPGRPVDYYLGWSYTLAAFYAAVQPFFPDLTLMKFSGLFVSVFASLTAIPAYFVGRMISNRWGGLMTALVAVISPKFVAVSVAGYPDSDVPVVFYTFLTVLTTFYAIRKADKLSGDFNLNYLIRYLPHIAPALLAYWLFAVNWNASWYIYFIFLSFIPMLILLKFIEAKIFHREKGHVTLLYQQARQSRNIILPIILIGILGEIVSIVSYHWPYFTIPPHVQLVNGLRFLQAGALEQFPFAILIITGGIAGLSLGRLKGLVAGVLIGALIAFLLMPAAVSGESSIVNQSITELQNVELSSGPGAIVTRIGIAPFLFGVIGPSIIILAKLFKRNEVAGLQYFILSWVMITLLLVGAGERFVLLLSVATAVTTGFVIGSMIEAAVSRKSSVLVLQFCGLILLGMAFMVADDVTYAIPAGQANEIPQDWIDAMTWLRQNADSNSMVVTWWDHGHMIAAYTGLKVHADGAHCSGCTPYSIDTRVVDMSKILSTRSEDEAIDILKKYTGLSPDDCRKIQDKFGSIVPDDACKSVTEVYVLTSNDLINKSYWMDYFASYDSNVKSDKDIGYQRFVKTGENDNGALVYGNGMLTIDNRNGEPIAVFDSLTQSAPDRIINEIIFYDDNGNQKRLDHRSSYDGANMKSGLIWVSPDWNQAVYMNDKNKESMFANLFFADKSLKHFQKVFQNERISIHKVVF